MKGQLYASHFCYLAGQAEFGHFSHKMSKLVLLGSSHMLPFNQFSTNEAIQCTEVYEYASSLRDASQHFALPCLQVR